MKNLIALTLALFTACASDTYDPTGVWAMTFIFTPGSCGLTGTADRTMTVSIQQGDYYVTSDRAEDAVPFAHIVLDASMAHVATEFINPDVLGDGHVQGTTTIDVFADDAMQLHGAGAIELTRDGLPQCSQGFAITGELR
jgi:hypothetical protein